MSFLSKLEKHQLSQQLGHILRFWLDDSGKATARAHRFAPKQLIGPCSRHVSGSSFNKLTAVSNDRVHHGNGQLRSSG